MALLTQDPAAAQAAQPMQQDPDAGMQPTAPPDAEQSQGLSFTTEQLVDSFKESMDADQAKDMGLVIDEGKDLLFGPDSHSQIMGMLETSKNIGEDLGNGAFDAMTLVITALAKEKPNEEINGKSILPAGVALISLALEFVNESGMAPVNDDTFEEASHIFSTRMMDAYDPEFKAKAQQYGGQQDQPAEGQPPVPGTPVDPATTPPGGM